MQDEPIFALDAGSAAPTVRKGNARPAVPKDVQVRVYFRDGWLCRYCHRPVVFAPALKTLAKLVADAEYPRAVAYYNLNYRSDLAPLLDYQAATIDHVEPWSKDGEHGEGNYVTACNKCNMKKSNRSPKAFADEECGKPVKGKYGPPKDWDGFVSVFLVLGKDPGALAASERDWRKAFERYLAERDAIGR